MRKEPTREQIQENLIYDTSTGEFTRRINSSTAKAGDVAGHECSRGFRLIGINGTLSGAHRIAWILMRGPIPDGYEIDHINCDQRDNRIENLRLASRTENARNRRMHKNNHSGFKGVYFDSSRKKWRARIVVDKKKIDLGRHDNPEVAFEAYKEAAIKYFGEFARF